MFNINNFIPPLSLNYNWSYDNEIQYKKDFIYPYLDFIIPNCIERFQCLNALSKTVKSLDFLDLGCGFSPFAVALKFALQSKPYSQKLFNSKSLHFNRYLGIDIRTDSINWLKNTFKNDRKFIFHLHESDKATDYVGEFSRAKSNTAFTRGESDGSECNYEINSKTPFDIQWSSSFFTHLTPNAVRKSLQFIKSSLSQNAVSINTWLIVDEHSRLGMQTGIADRKLEIDCGDFLTYSKSNPLVCTAYKLQFVEKCYRDAGLKILSIEKGSWRGGEEKNNFNHYQDVIISTRY